MDRHANIGREGAHFDGQHTFRDQFARARAHDTDTEHAFRLRIYEQLGETVGPVERDGTTRSGPRELGDGDLATLFLGLRFSQASPCDFGIGEHDRRNCVRLESNFVAGDVFHGGAAFMHCFVRQHRFAGYVADGVDRGFSGLALLVDFDEPLPVDFDFRLVEAGDLGIRPAYHRHHHASDYLPFFLSLWTFVTYALSIL